MAERKYFAIVTDKGNAKISQAVASGQKLNITTFVAGDGNGEYYVPTSDMTAIKNEVWRGTISKADVVQDAQKILRVTTVIPADVTGFVVRELGLLDDTGELIAIGNSVDLPKVSLQDGFSVELELSMRIAVKNTEVFSFTIDPHMVIMTKDMLDTHNVDSNAHEELFETKANKNDIETQLEGKANKEHNHSTDDITSGTLPVARGGTGNTTGNAATATKLQTARTITLSGDVTGNTTFDGTANKTITTALKNSGVAAGTYGADLIKLAVSTWISNNRGLHSTTATSTWTAKQDMTMSFRYTVSSESVSYDYLNITAAGTQILANTGGTATTNTLTATLKTGQTIVFNYRKDGSGNTNEDCAKISEVKVTPTGSTSATTVTTANFASYFTATNSTYGFLPLIELQKKSTSGGAGTNGFTLPCVTVDAKGRITAATEVFIMPAEGGGNIPLTIAEGGTGATTAAAARNNLGLGNTTGALPIANGGTGATTAAAARNALGLGNTSGAVPIANGGTGATTATNARTNLGAFSSSGGTISGNVTIQGKVAEGSGTTASGDNSHAEGDTTTASAVRSHAEGWKSKASGVQSHAEGEETTASGGASHAEGGCSQALGIASHAGCYFTIANDFQTSIGKFNVNTTGSAYSSTAGSAFVIGNGTGSSARSNCFRVQYNGATYAKGNYNSSGADYAELFKWLDDNKNKEDRTGLFVTVDGEEIRIATPDDDYIVGIISACPSVIGDVHDDTWRLMYLTDIFGRILYEEIDVPDEVIEIPDPENPEQTITQVVREAHKEKVPKLNPEYDNTQKYIPRSERPEWDAVGMLGKLVAIDDGSCEKNGWCTVGNGGVATKSEKRTKFRVMSRLDENHIKVLIL